MKVTKSSGSISRSLKQFEVMALESYPDPSRDHRWVFGVRVETRTRVVLRVNVDPSPNFGYLLRDDRGDSSFSVSISRWNSEGYQEIPVTTDENWVGVSLMNISPDPVQITLTMTSSLHCDSRCGVSTPESDVLDHLSFDQRCHLLCH